MLPNLFQFLKFVVIIEVFNVLKLHQFHYVNSIKHPIPIFREPLLSILLQKALRHHVVFF
jgi:hypothetical protein